MPIPSHLHLCTHCLLTFFKRSYQTRSFILLQRSSLTEHGQVMLMHHVSIDAALGASRPCIALRRSYGATNIFGTRTTSRSPSNRTYIARHAHHDLSITSPRHDDFSHAQARVTATSTHLPQQRPQHLHIESIAFDSHSIFHRARRRPLLEGSGAIVRARPIRTTARFESSRPSHATKSPKSGVNEGSKTSNEDGSSILSRLPDLSQRFHRPSKDELLAAATGFWSRLGIRFKWFSIRSFRPFNSDDISAFATWVVAGHIIWIIVGTTTFFSLLILAVNTVFAQGKPERI